MTKVYLMQIIVTTALSFYGLTPFWCDSCGNSYLDTEMVTCENCGAELCKDCADLYDETHGPDAVGCFVCEGRPGVDGHDESADPYVVPGLFI